MPRHSHRACRPLIPGAPARRNIKLHARFEGLKIPQTDTPEDADPIPCTWVTKEKSHKVSNLRSDRYRDTQILAHVIPNKFFANRIPPLGYEKTSARTIELANDSNFDVLYADRLGRGPPPKSMELAIHLGYTS